ncbi:MAG: 50S ribosomal protein L21 [Deltaproteobacteria bacterium]|jgi:large subunit ribosomal protein L21|nr:50S ribosomal protein L21 [Deltaproteobacteria bacterium]MBK8239193.1 50S ribosomal protein L21 [Deltaproteobacteria bacterium]MBK8719734.1 50S ribosomal protein L21 [Deltaproteobacteria bacterium]MBP7288651.1 50S ribosomal protein L21 [Nannocystaceae bacterium]
MSNFDQAVVRTGGKQYRIEPGATVRVEKLAGDVGTKIELDDVLLVGRGADAQVGTPKVAGAKVVGTIVAHGKHPKVIVYKFRRRKNYRRKRGHRQHFTEIKIEAISA